jgi:hypothetical protein
MEWRLWPKLVNHDHVDAARITIVDAGPLSLDPRLFNA